MTKSTTQKSPTRNLLAWLAALMLTAFCSFNSMAQLNYTRSTFSSAYVAISGTAAAATGDDVFAGSIPIGFSFNYNGTPYTTIGVNSNGWVSFTATASNAGNDALRTTTAPNATLAPWWDDLSSSSVQYLTTGTTPNQVFTMQWTSLSYYTTSTRTINYQVKLYETSNVIEFWYGSISGTGANGYSSESASIGIENQTGGLGNYIDAVSGSKQIYNGTLNAGQWPTQNYRFTPGAPAAIAAGTYNVGAAQTYTSLTEAVADINHRGVSGAVTLNLTDALYTDKTAGGSETYPIVFGPVTGTSASNTITITGNGADLRYAGSVAGSWGNGSATGTMFGTTAEPILGVCGTDYLTVNNLKLTALTGVVYYTNTGTPTRVDRGLAVQNSGAIDGATNNNFNNITITLDRTNTSTLAIDQGNSTAPTSAAGANSTNKYKDLIIKNTQKGISLGGNATYPDIGCEIGTALCTNFNTIGDPATANDIGNTSTAAFGIQATNQQDVKIYNNSVRNVTGSAVQTDGINIITFQGTSSVYNNKVQTIKNSSTSSTTAIAGIRASHTTTGTHTLRIYNNAVSEIISSYTGAAVATRTLKGIFIAGTGGLTTQVYEVYDNSVSMNGSASPNLSSTCFEIATTSGPVFKLANNIFANFTAAQGATAKHSCIVSTSATAFGPAGTSSNNNDFYVANDVGVSGFMGIGNATTYNTVALWAAAMVTPAGMEAASVALDPLFTSTPSNLHIAASGLNGTGQAPPGYVTVDLDCATRTPDNDIGAYKIDGCITAVGGTISPASQNKCVGQTATMTSVGATGGAGITYQWEISATGGGVGFANVSGGSGATSTSYTTAALTAGTYYYRLNVTCSTGPVTGYSNELTVVVNALPTVTATPSSASYCAPSGTAVSIAAGGASTYVWSPASGLSATTGTPVSANPGSTTTYTVTGTDGNGCTGTATSAITVAPSVYVNSVTATPASVCAGGSTALATVAGTTAAYTMSSATFGLLTPSGSPTNTATGDDLLLNTVTLPFNFSFFGTAYSSLLIYSNGYVAFQTGVTGSPYVQTIPSNVAPDNFIAISHDDLNVTAAGQLRYFTNGSTPNRIFVIDYVAVKYYNTAANNGNLTGQIQLFEADGHIEIHVSNSVDPVLSAKSLGIENVGGTLGYAPGTRNNLSYDITTPEAWKFVPSGGTLSYLWSESPANATLTSTSTNPTSAIGITVNETYSVAVSDVSGCSASGSVNVTAGSVLSCTAATYTSPNCAGSNFTVTANPSGGGTPYSYSWSDGVGGIYPNAQTITANLAAGTYTFTCTVTDACLNNCTSSVTVTVNGLPSVTATPSSALYCNPGAGVSIAASGASTYAWSPASGLSATTGTPVIASPSANTTYTVVGTDANGCTASATSAISVGSTVTISSTTASPSTICSGDNSVLTVNASTSTSYCTIPNVTSGTCASDEWISNTTFGTINQSSACTLPVGYTDYTSLSTNVSPAGSPYSISVGIGQFFTGDQVRVWIDFNHDGTFNDVTEAFACTGAASPYTGSISIPGTALNGPTRMRVRLTYTGSILPCGSAAYGEVEDYIVNISGATDQFTYLWSPGTFLSSTSTNPTTATAVTSTTAYSVTVTETGGCSATGNVTVNVNTPPVISACPADITQCDNHVATWTDPTATGTPTPTVVCSPLSGSTFAAGTTLVTCTATNSCGTSSCSFNVTINDSPVISACPANITQCDNAVATWTDPTATGTPTPTVVCSPLSGSTFGLGTTLVTCTATNSCGTSSCSFNVTINESPVISACPANITQCDNAVATWTDPTATGTPTPTVVCSPLSGSTFGLGTTLVTCTATNSCGTSSCSFNVTINESPVISACPANITQCDNAVATWTDPTATGTPAPSVVCSPLSGSTFVTGTTLVTCTATNSCGTSSCSFNVTINESATAPTSVTTDDGDNEICTSGTITLTANGGTLGSPAGTYTWYEGGCGTGSVIGTGTTLVRGPGLSIGTHVYYVRINQAACGNTTCASVTVIVTGAPPATNVPFPTVPAYACNGNNLPASTSPVTYATTYTWDGPAGTTFNSVSNPYASGSTSVTVNYGAPNGSGYNICVQASNACGTTTRRCSFVRGTVNVPGVITPANNRTIECPSTSANYSIVAVGGATSYTWSITGNATVVGSGTSATVSFGAGWTSGTLSVTANTPCFSSAPRSLALSNVSALPGAISGPVSVCPGGPAQVYSVPAVAGASTYNWVLPPNATGSSSSNSISVTFLTGYTFGNIKVSITSICGNTSAQQSKTVSTGIPGQPASISGNASGLCNQTQVYSCPSVTGATSYTWSVTGGTINSGQGSTSISASFTSLTNGTVCVTANNGCGSSAPRCLPVIGKPAISGNIVVSPGTVCANQAGVDFQVNPAFGTTGYNWVFPAGVSVVLDLGNEQIVNWGAVSGTVTVTAANACGNSTKSTVVTLSCREAGTTSVEANSSVSVYPNPAHDRINVQFNAAEKTNYVLNLMDLSGRVISTANATAQKGMNTSELDLSSLAKGVYMIEVKSDLINKQIRVVVE